MLVSAGLSNRAVVNNASSCDVLVAGGFGIMVCVSFCFAGVPVQISLRGRVVERRLSQCIIKHVNGVGMAGTFILLDKT